MLRCCVTCLRTIETTTEHYIECNRNNHDGEILTFCSRACIDQHISDSHKQVNIL